MGSLIRLHDYIPGPIFMKNTTNDVVPGKKCLLEGPGDNILYFDRSICIQSPFCGPILTGHFLRPKTALREEGVLKYKLCIIVIVAP